jgi:hypothetical protein
MSLAAPNLATQLLAEDPIGFADLARRIRSRRRDGSVTSQCCWRWHTRGVRLADGRTVRLEAVRCAGRYLTSLAAYARFVAAQNDEPGEANPLPAPARSASKRQREDAVAAELLEKVGI